MSIDSLRNELHEYIDDFGLNDQRTVDKSQELDRALNESENLEHELVYYMKRCVRAERILKGVEGFCPVLHRMEISIFLNN